MRKIPTTFDEIFKITSEPFFIPNFNLLSCQLCVILSHFTLKQKIKLECFYSFKKSQTVSFSSSTMKNIVACRARFPVKLICCIAFVLVSSVCCLLKSIALIL